jgi:hypothetical protein
MREFAPARVCLTPRFAGDLCGRLELCRVSLCLVWLCQGPVCQGPVCQGRLCRECAVCQGPRLSKGGYCRCSGFSGARFLEAAVSRGGGFSGRGFLGAGGFLGWGFSVDRFGRGRRSPALVVLGRRVRGTGFVEERSFWTDRGSAESGFVGDRVCRGLGLSGTGACRSGS